MNVYEWAPGAPIRSVDPEKVGRVVERVTERYGPDAPARLVKEARRPSHVLHDVFEWDDSAAAGLWRVHRARQVINHIVVRRVNGTESAPVRAFVSVVSEGERQYVHADRARERPELFEQVRDGFLRDLARIEAQLAGWDQFAHAATRVTEARELVEGAA